MLNAANFCRLGAVGIDEENVAAGRAARKNGQPATLWRPRNGVEIDANFELRYALRRRLSFVHAIDERRFVARLALYDAESIAFRLPAECNKRLRELKRLNGDHFLGEIENLQMPCDALEKVLINIVQLKILHSLAAYSQL